MDIKCSKCGKNFNNLFDTVVNCDYLEPGKGKPYKWDLCINCRKKLIKWIEGD